MNILDYIHTNSTIFLVGVTLVVITIVVLWIRHKNSLLSELDWYWKEFASKRGCDCAHRYWANGDRIIEKYGYLPDGCSSRVIFCMKAIDGLSKYISLHRDNPALKDRIAMLNDDLNKLSAQLERIRPRVYMQGLKPQ